jgi:hypothetical protein
MRKISLERDTCHPEAYSPKDLARRCSQILRGVPLRMTRVAVVAFSICAMVRAESASTQSVFDYPPEKIKYAKGYPIVPSELKEPAAARDAEWDRLDDEAWHRAEPEVARWAANGKPYIALALNPEDLPRADIPAFPGAEGGAMYTTGGRGGKIFVVTSLADSGPGTLREACEAGGPRIVVFAVAGIIHLDRPIHIHAPYITVAGQSAPGDGICVAGRSFKIDTHDAIIRYMRFRRGIIDVTDRDDALGGDEPIGNILIDHCSVSWGLDETLSIYRQMYAAVPGDRSKRLKLPAMNITIQWTIISEGLNTYHHAFGATWGGRNSMFAHNLFACNTGRNASIGMNYDFNFVNNVIFNWHHRTLDGGDDLSMVNVINNYYKPGPATMDSPVKYRIILPQPRRVKDPNAPRPFGRCYVDGNIVDGNEKVTADNWDGGVQFPKPGANELSEDTTLPADHLKALIAEVKLEHPLPMAPVTILPAKEAYDAALANCGATLPKRDPVDVRVLEEVRSGKPTYQDGIITDIKQVGGYPQYQGAPVAYSQHDGIPDWWKKKYNLDVNDPELASKDTTGDGYTNIEKYLDGIDPTKKMDWKDLKNNVNTLSAEKLVAAATASDPKEVAYTNSINKRADDILAALQLSDAAKVSRVHDILTSHYRDLRDAKDAAGRKALHGDFVAKLGSELSPEQVEIVKDKLTYNKVQVTYDAYVQIVPGLTSDEKTTMLAMLKDAREEAMDGGSADEKSAVFKKYKGKINNYLSKNGHDVAKAYKDWGAAQKAKQQAAN